MKGYKMGERNDTYQNMAAEYKCVINENQARKTGDKRRIVNLEKL